MAGISPDAWLSASVTLGLAGVGGLIWLAKRALQSQIESLVKLTTKELTHNGGSSTKDMARDGRNSASQALAVAERVASAGEETRAMVLALHRRYDADRETDSYRAGERTESIRRLQHDVTATRMGLALHVYESNQAMKTLNEHGIDLPPMTHPEGSPLAPQRAEPGA